ncbi:MAG TPA: NUDIX domain-containing protein [Clostridiales bacterium]|nr:NUDIX domain-containing protein [Clostridiales bacterium]
MESWDILNERGKATGKTVVRGSVQLNPGEYHLVVHIWVVGSDGRLLIQRRSKNKLLMPGEWAATGGAAISGETSVDAAIRELYEELSIKADKNDMVFVKRLTRRNSFVDIWLTKTDIDISDLKLQKSEVSAIKWVTVEELNQMIKSGDFHNYGSDYFETVLGAISNLNSGL